MNSEDDEKLVSVVKLVESLVEGKSFDMHYGDFKEIRQIERGLLLFSILSRARIDTPCKGKKS